MKATIANCKTCNNLFKKMTVDYCPNCFDVREENFKNVYRALQRTANTGGIAINELAENTETPLEMIEEFYHEGRLATASVLLKFPCASCGDLIPELQRKGRYCVNCSEKVANKAGVEVRSKQDLEKVQKEEMKKQQQASLLKKTNAKEEIGRRFGFSSRRGR